MAEPAQSPRVLYFGTFEFDRRTGELRKQCIKVKVLGQPVDILGMLLERPGEMVTREELRAKLWPGDRFVDFEHSLNAAVNKLREALGDSADNPRFIETLPRRGYRFIAPVEGPRGAPPRIQRGPGAPKIRSLAVLPLKNLSRDHEQEYFVDGMTEALITELSKISALKVISRTSAMRYKSVKKPIR